MNSIIKNILFDIDGTLIGQKIRGDITLRTFYLENKEKFDNVSEKEFFNLWLNAGKINFQQFLKGEISFEEKITSQILEVFKHSSSEIDRHKANMIFNKFLPLYEENLQLYEDVIPCLEDLKKEGYRLGIISNGHSEDQRKKLNKFGIKDYFSTIVISGDIGFAKPNPKIFLESIKILNVDPQDVIYIGDMIEMDIIAANKVGMKAIWINRAKREVKFDGPSISDLTNLKEIIEMK